MYIPDVGRREEIRVRREVKDRWHETQWRVKCHLARKSV